MNPEEVDRSLVNLAGRVMHLTHRVDILEGALAVMLDDKISDGAAFVKALHDLADEKTEQRLLSIGDTDPELARLADALNKLRDDKRGGA